MKRGGGGVFAPVDKILVCKVYSVYCETSLIHHSVGLEKSVGLGGCRITE